MRHGPKSVKKEKDVGFAWQPSIRKAFQVNSWIALDGALKGFTGERTEAEQGFGKMLSNSLRLAWEGPRVTALDGELKEVQER